MPKEVVGEFLEVDGSVPQGGVKNHTILACPRCNQMVIVPPETFLRIPANPQGDFCHETADVKTGKSKVRG